ncbi:MAG TPA: ANTAR domain-containing protein [Bacillota bacterium]|nr:ANTAR domain-containing protein [Bacillota bacterium]
MKLNDTARRHNGFIYSVLVVSGDEGFPEFVRKILPPEHFSPFVCVQSSAQARSKMSCDSFDLVLINTPLRDEFGTELASRVTETDVSGVVIAVKNDMFDEISYCAGKYGVITVAKPVSGQAFTHAADLALATRDRFRRLQSENELLMKRFDEVKTVSRAKCILIEYLKMTENEAHKYIEKQAMDTRHSRGEVAKDIIKAYGR